MWISGDLRETVQYWFFTLNLVSTLPRRRFMLPGLQRKPTGILTTTWVRNSGSSSQLGAAASQRGTKVQRMCQRGNPPVGVVHLRPSYIFPNQSPSLDDYLHLWGPCWRSFEGLVWFGHPCGWGWPNQKQHQSDDHHQTKGRLHIVNTFKALMKL